MANKVRVFAAVIGPLAAFSAFWGMETNGWSYEASVTLGIAVLCAIWWVTQPISLPATSFIPLASFPLFGVLTVDTVIQTCLHPLFLLVVGGIMLSKSVENSGAHRRIALAMVKQFSQVHDSPKMLVLGFMLTAALTSMWMSNIATTVMLLPVALAVLSGSDDSRLRLALLLGIAYGSNIGGLGTPIASFPNMLFSSEAEKYTGQVINFAQWMLWATPAVLLFVPISALWLTRGLGGSVQVHIDTPGGWKPAEVRSLVVFGLTVLAWFTMEKPIVGWKQLLDLPYANYGSVALVAVIISFLVSNGNGGRLLDFKSFRGIRWGLLLMLAGSMVLAKAFLSSGLSKGLGLILVELETLPIFLLLVLICLSVTFLTEFISNTAMAAVLLPILSVVAAETGIRPELLMFPAVLSCSCAFMLPVSTGPNALVYTHGGVSAGQMMKEGVGLNLLGVMVVSTVCYLLM